MTIVQQGAINTTAQLVPDLLVQIVPPSNYLLNGVPTNVLGIVGTGTWGPVNSPTDASGVTDGTQLFGRPQVRKYDLMTAVAAAALQGANAFKLVRVTDGTDTAASGNLAQGGVGSATVAAGGSGYSVGNQINLAGGAVLTVATVSSGAVTGVTVTTPGSYGTPPANPVPQSSTSGSGTGATFNLTFPTGLTLNAKYTGTTGNALVATLNVGSAANSYKLTVSLPGLLPEVYDNITGSGNALYQAIAAAVNLGANTLRGKSEIVTASAGAATGAPAPSTIAFSGGTDGATTITSATLVGQDIIPRKGMYALRATGASVAMLADADDSTQWTLQQAFGLSEGIYMIATSPAGDTISNFAATIASAGIDGYSAKVMFGDWVYINDNVNGVTRLISPQGFEAGKLAALSPEQSSLNKPLNGIVATQKTFANQKYSGAELQALALARADLITNPAPGGSYFAARFGRNSSSNAVIHGDNYTRMTNYIASTLNAGMGIYIGQLQSDTTRQRAKATIDNFLQAMYEQGMIEDWQVILDKSNNPPNRVALGYMQADVKVRYLSIIEYFICNLESGQSVQITRSNAQPAA
ncbi:phage tail protein [Tundrisphaera sp. TA3]|uniref:phage tail protein n=1 Tax=Tundrisphaera sp. TA3 TaxID=3435775 RepID=UPI003EBEA4A4